MIPVAEALAALFALAPPPVPERVPLAGLGGRVLLEPLAARRDQPPFDASAMDGYAVRSADARPGARLRLVGESAAGRRFPGTLGAGEAVRILTGAPLPRGADAVVVQEDATRDGGHVLLGPGARAGHVRPAGADFRAGATLPAPRLLSPGDVALVAAFGHAEAAVARPPDVAILATGDELAAPGDDPNPDQVFAANAFGLAALVREAGACPRLLPMADDTPEGLAQGLALAEGADILVTVGGASVGDHDLVAPAARAAGATLAFHKVALRPGKPLLAGRLPWGGMLLGLPGNPVSAMVCGTLFLRPVILAALGLPALPAPRRPARLASPLPPNGPREHYLRAALRPDGAVAPFDRQDSSLLSVLADADALVVQPPGDPGRPAGAEVEIVTLRRNGLTQTGNDPRT